MKEKKIFEEMIGKPIKEKRDFLETKQKARTKTNMNRYMEDMDKVFSKQKNIIKLIENYKKLIEDHKNLIRNYEELLKRKDELGKGEFEKKKEKFERREEKIREEKRKTRKEIITQELPLAVKIAKNVQQKLNMPDNLLSELVQRSNLKLIKAIDSFIEKLEKGERDRFSLDCLEKYLELNLKEEISNGSLDVIRIPNSAANLVHKYHQTKDQLRKKLGREPSTEEIHRELGWGKIRMKHVLDGERSLPKKYVSLDQSVESKDGETSKAKYYDVIPDPSSLDISEEIAKKEEGKLIKEIIEGMSNITDRDRKILSLYFGLDGEDSHNYQEIGDKYKLTRGGVGQIIKRLLEKIRQEVKRKKFRRF